MQALIAKIETEVMNSCAEGGLLLQPQGKRSLPASTWPQFDRWVEIAEVLAENGTHGLALKSIAYNFSYTPPYNAKTLNRLGKLISPYSATAAMHLFVAAIVRSAQHAKPKSRWLIMDQPARSSLSLLRAAVACQPKSLTLRFLLGWHLIGAGQAREAEEILLPLRASVRTDGAYWLALGLAYHALRRPARERACLLIAGRLATDDDPQLLIRLAEAQEAAGLAQPALLSWGKAMVDDDSMGVRQRYIGHVARGRSPAATPRSLPLALVTQIQRSGGTLLSQLFDGHPQILSHPHEIQIGHPEKWNWPNLDLSAAPEDWLAILFERRLPVFVERGYVKADGNKMAANDVRPFNLDLAALCQSFLAAVNEVRPQTQRAVIDAYFNSFFAAWRDYPVSGQERWVAGFTPRLISNRGSVERLRSDYPDGLIICCVRDPWSWYASSRRHDAEYQNAAHAIELWKTSTLSALYAQKEAPERVHLMTYSGLVQNTEAEMRRLAERMRIDFLPSLLQPSLLGQPILSNSSYPVQEYGVHRASLEGRKSLTAAEAAFIDSDAGALYDRLLKEAGVTR